MSRPTSAPGPNWGGRHDVSPGVTRHEPSTQPPVVCDRLCCDYYRFQEEHGPLTEDEFEELEIPWSLLDAFAEALGWETEGDIRELIADGTLRVLLNHGDWFTSLDWQEQHRNWDPRAWADDPSSPKRPSEGEL